MIFQLTSSLTHVTDWLPTLYAAGGGNVADLGSIDGLNQWDSITKGVDSPRTEMLYNIRPERDFMNGPGAALR